MFKKIPHTYVIIFYIIVFAAILTWIIPGGEYNRKTITTPNGIERTVIDKDSFHYVQKEHQTWHIFSALFKGFENQSGIIVFILMIGGAFWIMNASKAIDVGIFAFLKFTQKLEHVKFIKTLGVNNLIIVLVMVMFSIFGAVFGMSEETIAFIIILVPLAISMGYDSIVGVCMVYVAAHLGFASAVLNPFTIGIAQGIADLPLFSGFEYRLFCWLIINSIGISFVLWYAHRVKAKPERSPMYKLDEYWRKRGNAHLESITYETPVMAWITYLIILAGLVKIVHWHELDQSSLSRAYILDVREPDEVRLGKIEGATNIPLNSLRDQLEVVPRDSRIVVYCAAGLRAYLACRILSQHGFSEVYNLSGGYKTYEFVTEKQANEDIFEGNVIGRDDNIYQTAVDEG